MAESGIYVRDIHSLEGLNGTIGSSANAMMGIDRQVNSYLNEVKVTLEKQLEFIRGKLQEAEEKLREAESELNSCLASQIVIEGVVIPTCISEESAVIAARAEVAEWTRRHTEGTRIMGECTQEIAEYRSSSGGSGLIRTMCEKQTPQATQQLCECIEKLHDILGYNVVDGDNTGIDNVVQEPVQSPTDNNRIQYIKSRFKL